MENYFDRLPRDFRSKKNIVTPLIFIGLALFGLISVVTFITENTDIRNLAATPNPGHIPQGCYYVRGNCTGSETKGVTGSCRPILICPTATPTITPTLAPSITPTGTIIPTSTATPTVAITPTPIPSAKLTCQTCLNENADSLCLNLKEKTSTCINGIDTTNNLDKVCVPCKPLPPSPTPYRCIFRPPCLDANPPCTDQKPIEGWCIVGSPNMTFQQ